MPENTVISGRLPDNSLKLDLTIKNLEVTADARYYLLRDRMESFRKNLGDVKDAWKYAEYVVAYLQVWTGKRVELNESRSRALFQIAWALHELSNFGSSDYLATSRALSNYPQLDRLLEGCSAEVIVEPIKEGEIQDLSEKADAAVRHLRDAGSKLRSAVSEMRELKQFKPKKQIELISNRLIALQGRIKNSSSEDIEKEFNEGSS
ncbi:hypothetical protein AKJ45_02035 [candidate division MSBL1 archaeon SCGC-AAA261F19]|nr:hypothetical protein AKJ45_02035 [candidate division MSBL1 archaeon SCGC-AAA261F19]